MIEIKTIEDVVNYQLCNGCGMCSAAEPDRFEMHDVEDFGKRPKLKSNRVTTTGEAFSACSGHSIEHSYNKNDPSYVQELADCWGPVLGVWEGFANDDEIRFSGSSGGAATALANFALSENKADYVIHTGADQAKAYTNITKKSYNKSSLLENSGSRYSPASPCDSIHTIKQNEKVVFIGKPCDVASLHKRQLDHPETDKKIALKIGFFCAGTPSTSGNKALLSQENINPNKDLKSLKFRGQGWPGMWRADYQKADGLKAFKELTYADSWGFLQRFRQWRCYICPDHTAEFADIAVGDPWYRKVENGEPGKSLIIARTQKGLDFLLAAEQASVVILETKDSSLLPRSQPNLIKARGDIWARLFILRLFNAPTPSFKGFKFFKFWMSASTIKNKLGSLYGTATRIKRKSLKENQKIMD